MSGGPNLATAASEPLTTAQIDILRTLARGALPLQDWIQAKLTRYKPEDNPSWLEPVLNDRHPSSVPWRQTTLTTDDLGAIEYLLETLRAPEDAPARHRRWEVIRSDPLRFCPIRDSANWRLERGLSERPQFDPFLAGNEHVIGGNVPLYRPHFYREFADLLLGIQKDGHLSFNDARKAAELLWQDQVAAWPSTLKSSVYLAQFARDLLAAVLGMRNSSPRSDSPLWKYAVLIELGEHRRAGNAHTPELVKKTVDLFERRLQEQLP